MAGPYEGERLYQTSIAGNAVIIATFAALLPAVLVLGYRYHTVAFTITLTTGIILEILGFAGRLLLNSREGNQSFFTLYFLGTILGPSFIASAIFSILPHLILIYHNGISPLKSGHVGLVFVSLVLLNVLLEIVGAIFTVFGATEEIRHQSTRVLLAGLVVLIASLLLCAGIQLWLVFKARSSGVSVEAQHVAVYSSARFKRFLLVLQIATALIFATTIGRITEAARDNGPIISSDTAATILYGALPLLACILITIFHPSYAFGPAWAKTAPQYVSRLDSNVEGHQGSGTTPTLRERRLESNPHSRFSVRKVTPMPLAAGTPNPYELYSSGPSPGFPSPGSNGQLSPASNDGYPSPRSQTSGYPSPLRASYTSKSPKRFSYSSRSPGHSPRKLPENRLVDDDALW